MRTKRTYAKRRSPLPASVRLVLMALILLIAAGCGGASPEPDQVRTTIAPPVPVTESEARAAPTTDRTGPTDAETPDGSTSDRTDPTETPTPETSAPDRTDTAEATDPPAPAQPPADQTGSAVADPPPAPAPPQGDARVGGSVSYRERIALTPGATLTVQLRDTSLMDVASELIAEQVIHDPGQVPISFEIAYESARIDPGNTYSISARIDEADGRLAFINDTAYDVITRGNPTKVDMVLVLVQPPPDMVDGTWSAGDDRPVEAPVTVTGTEVIWEPPDAYVRVTFVISEQDGCYRRGREEAIVDGTDISVTVTAWVPPPAPWAIDCSEETLELDAIAHVGDSLASGQTYTIAVNGEHATTFAAP